MSGRYQNYFFHVESINCDTARPDLDAFERLISPEPLELKGLKFVGNIVPNKQFNVTSGGNALIHGLVRTIE